MFISVWGLKVFDGSRNEYDDVSDILIARSGKLCVGGGRRQGRRRRSAPARVVCDYIAGMTDRYAAAEHRRLFDETPDLP